MSRNMILLVLILVLFLVFYSAFYYYAINLDDKNIFLSQENSQFSATLEQTIDQNRNSFAVPFADIFRDQLEDQKRQWGIFCNPANTDKQNNDNIQQKCRIRLREKMVFRENFYSATEKHLFNNVPVRMLTGRPGHSGRSARLYEDGESRIAKIFFHDDDRNFFLVSQNFAPETTFSDIWKETRETISNSEGEQLRIENNLTFPIMRWIASVENFTKQPADSLFLEEMESEIIISSAQRDVSLLPSRRFSGEDEDQWLFNQDYILIVTRNDLPLPLFMAYIQDAEILDQGE